MAYGRVDEKFWYDHVIRGLPETARLFMLYLLTCPHRNRLGCFVLDPHYAAGDLQWTHEQVIEALQALEGVGRIAWDSGNRVVFLNSHWKHNYLANPNVVKGAKTDLRSLPDTPLFQNLLVAIEGNQDGRTSVYKPLVEAVRDRSAACTTNGLPNGSPNGSEPQAAEGESNGLPNNSPAGSETPYLDLDHTIQPQRVVAKKTKKKKPNNYPPEFLTVWALHPRGAKGAALEEWRRAVPELIADQPLRNALEAYCRTLRPDFQGMHLFRWLRDERWEEATATQSAGPKMGMLARP